jgi:hypothetical protein
MSLKRQRANSDGDALSVQSAPQNYPTINVTQPEPPRQSLPPPLFYNPKYPIEQVVHSIHPAIVSRLLVDAAKQLPHIAHLICYEYDRVLEAERNRVIDFDQVSKSVWHLLNRKHSGYAGSNRVDISRDAEEGVRVMVNSIWQNVFPDSCFRTKQSALLTLRKIGKTICLSEGSLGHQLVQEIEDGDTMMEDAMTHVLTSMSSPELSLMFNDREFMEKMDELVKLADDRGIFAKLEAAVMQTFFLPWLTKARMKQMKKNMKRKMISDYL